MKFKMLGLLSAVLLLFMAVAAVSAHGHSPDQLVKAGWFACIPGVGDQPPDNWTHCIRNNPFVSDPPATVQVKVFGPGGHPFLGTEILIHKDVYKDQPCATDGGGLYHDVEPILGIPYVACHHFSTDH